MSDTTVDSTVQFVYRNVISSQPGKLWSVGIWALSDPVYSWLGSSCCHSLTVLSVSQCTVAASRQKSALGFYTLGRNVPKLTLMSMYRQLECRTLANSAEGATVAASHPVSTCPIRANDELASLF